MLFRAPSRRLVALGAALWLAGVSVPARAQEVDVDLASKIILKIMMLDQDLQKKTGGKIEIGVIGSPEAVQAFTRLKGSAIDKDSSISVGEVVAFDALPPGQKPTIVFVGSAADPAAVTKYTRGNRVLSVTNVSGFVDKGVTLGVGLENNKPKVLLNLTGSESEGMNWDPKILKISKTVR
jgi:hypothetical protein